MSDNTTLELTARQRELILEGLRCVRNSRRFEFREPSQPVNQQREDDIRLIGDLLCQLEPAATTVVPAKG